MNFYGHIIFTVFNLLLPRLLLELRNCFSAPVGIWLLPLLHTGSYGVNQFTLVNRFLNGLITKVYTRRKKRKEKNYLEVRIYGSRVEVYKFR